MRAILATYQHFETVLIFPLVGQFVQLHDGLAEVLSHFLTAEILNQMHQGSPLTLRLSCQSPTSDLVKVEANLMSTS